MSDPAPFQLRPATDADREAVNALWHASAGLPSVGVPALPSREALRKRLDAEWDGPWRVTLAVRDAAILGFAALKPAERILDQLFVHPDALGRGVSSALLAHAKAEMPEGFTLHTLSANALARGFYEASGLTLLRHGALPATGTPITYYGWGGAAG
ncbi:GNAT family N-acetyltransferase [Aureimonas sp. AU20]|uniref:GNAT family N-acetyltransferase n=1 Tax=Aureimonas sp. AU20 TaxID=1349819 RepID=UPI00071F5C75|nr:GNAT family N-acetyltransferase [Aureimonas sp. AU20]ALN71660.1 hypothetical protein M673_02985 [Aureimonas sp. AU20]